MSKVGQVKYLCAVLESRINSFSAKPSASCLCVFRCGFLNHTALIVLHHVPDHKMYRIQMTGVTSSCNKSCLGVSHLQPSNVPEHTQRPKQHRCPCSTLWLVLQTDRLSESSNSTCVKPPLTTPPTLGNG